MVSMKRIILILCLVVIAAGIYLFPKMINQRDYNKYLLYVPDEVPETGKYPLLLYLHGSGARGNDLSVLENHGPRPFLMNHKEFPFVLVSPLCKKDDSWHPLYLLRMLDSIEAKLPIDKNRIYVTGLSMGGNGTWNLARAAPDRFAAIAPLCGRAHFETEDVKALKDLSIWAFHGKKDDLVPYQASERLVNKLEEINADVKYTLYPELGHRIWDETYGNPDLYHWLLSKIK